MLLDRRHPAHVVLEEPAARARQAARAARPPPFLAPLVLHPRVRLLLDQLLVIRSARRVGLFLRHQDRALLLDALYLRHQVAGRLLGGGVALRAVPRVVQLAFPPVVPVVAALLSGRAEPLREEGPEEDSAAAAVCPRSVAFLDEDLERRPRLDAVDSAGGVAPLSGGPRGGGATWKSWNRPSSRPTRHPMPQCLSMRS